MPLLAHSEPVLASSKRSAIQLSNSRVLSEEEKLFQEALKSVQDEKKRHGTLPVVFDRINYARTIGDVQYLFQDVKKENSFWTMDIGKAWLRHLANFAECLWQYKPVLDAVATRSATVAAPIWGSIAFLLSFFKDLPATELDLKTIEHTLEQSRVRFKRYYETGRALTTDLKSALIKYYETIINFVVDMHREFSRGRTTTVIRAVHRTLKTKLADLNKNLRMFIDDVDKSGMLVLWTHTNENIDKLRANTQISTAGHLSSTVSINGMSVRSITHGLPPPSHAFVGRRQYLGIIWRSLHGNSHCQRRVALYGMGGIGKSQILQKYANDHVKPAAKPQQYAITFYINAHSASSVFSAVCSFMRLHAANEALVNSLSENDYNAFHTWLLQRQNWLLIFDNVQAYNHILKAIPHGNSGHVLCSTRHKTIAQQFSNGYGSHPVEIKEMGTADSTELVLSLAGSSPYEADKDPVLAARVASFAKGIPLVIEQIVHNALLGKTSLLKTLQVVSEKAELLRQNNVSSLHPDNLALGGVVMQAFETLQQLSERAEALFMILVYMEPSSIPLSMVREGSKQLQDYLGRQHTYDRGTIEKAPEGRRDHRNKDGTCSSRSCVWHNASSLRPSIWSRVMRPRPRSARRAHAQAALPVDDIELTSSLRQKCDPGSALGRLFENQVMIDDAITVLCDAAVIRKIGPETLWMHDLVSEVAKALTSDRSITSNQITALAAATTVYLAFPVPDHKASRKERAACEQYFPHAIACHHNLKSIGILNDCSIGPELSHIIASALDNYMSHGNKDGYPLSTEQYNENKTRAIEYYTDAYTGYLAGWERLKHNYGIDDERIYFSTYADREREKDPHYFRYYGRCERFGRSAPWRAIQTAVTLSDQLERQLSQMPEQDPMMLERVLSLTRHAVDFHKLSFGTNDYDTIGYKQTLYYRLGPLAGRWHEAYDVSIETIKDIVGWPAGSSSVVEVSRLQHGKCTNTGLPLDQLGSGGGSTGHLGKCCIELSRFYRHTGDSIQAQRYAEEAVTWCQLGLRWVQCREGAEFYVCRDPMMLLAEAHELANEGWEAMRWYAKAVVCTMNVERGRLTEFRSDDEDIEARVHVYTKALGRLNGAWEAEDVCSEVKELLHAVQGKIRDWKVQMEEKAKQEKQRVRADWELPIDWEAILRLPAT